MIKALLFIIIVSLIAGCQLMESSKMDCQTETETETKKVCNTK